MQANSLDNNATTAECNLEDKMQVRFDKVEMEEFYACFEPMDIQSCLDIFSEDIPLSEAA